MKRGITITSCTKSDDLKDFSIFGGHLGRSLGFRKMHNDAAMILHDFLYQNQQQAACGCFCKVTHKRHSYLLDGISIALQ